MKNNNYSINFIEGTITITKRFSKCAGRIGTPEFEEMLELRKAYPDYKFVMKEIAKNSSKRTYSGLTIPKMIATITVLKGEAKALDFEKRISVIENKRSKYGLIKKYFLSLFEEGVLDSITPEQELNIEKEIESIDSKRIKFPKNDNTIESAIMPKAV